MYLALEHTVTDRHMVQILLHCCTLLRSLLPSDNHIRNFPTFPTGSYYRISHFRRFLLRTLCFNLKRLGRGKDLCLSTLSFIDYRENIMHALATRTALAQRISDSESVRTRKRAKISQDPPRLGLFIDGKKKG